MGLGMTAPCSLSRRLQQQLRLVHVHTHLFRARVTTCIDPIQQQIRAFSYSNININSNSNINSNRNRNSCQRQRQRHPNNVLCLQQFHRSFATTRGKNSITNDDNDDGHDDSYDNGHDDCAIDNAIADSSHLLMRATAQQLKGDVGEAIALTSRAISIMKKHKQNTTSTAKSKSNAKSNTTANEKDEIRTLSEDIADALLFLGKLYQLQGGFGNAFESFSEARRLYQQMMVQPQTQLQQQQAKKKELTALSHMASARSRWLAEGADNPIDVDVDVDELFREALEGLEDICGWQDGMTNHTAHEWSLHARRGNNTNNNTTSNSNPRKALSILTNMKQKLAGVFGPNDHRVLQLNGELAELWHLVSALPASNGTDDTTNCNSNSTDERNKRGGEDLDTSAAATSTTTTTAPTTTTTTAEENAMALLEEALDNLPPNSPEARRIFMQLEEWKDQQQQQKQKQQQQQQGGIAATTVGGVAVTFTKGRGGN